MKKNNSSLFELGPPVVRGTIRARYKTNFKTRSRFPNFDTSNAWQMGHRSQKCFFLVQELLLDFAAWIDLTSNADNSIISAALKVREHILLL